MHHDDDKPPVRLDLRRPFLATEACTLLGVSVRTLQRRINAGDLERVDIPGAPVHVRILPTPWSHGKLAEIERRDSDAATSPAPPVVADILERDGLVSHADLEQLGERVADLEDWIESRETTREDATGSPYRHGDGREGDQRADTLTGWRAVCVAILVRLKLLLDALMRVVRGERG